MQLSLDLIPIFKFLVSIYMFSVPGILILKKVFKNEVENVWHYSKVFGLLTVTYLSWLLSFIHPIKHSFTLILLVYFVLTIPLIYFSSFSIRLIIYKNLKSNLLSELIFIIFFAAMIVFRGANPQIEGIEKFTDFAIYNGLYRAQNMPPQDVWLSGNNVNYYYFGHLFFVTLNKVTKIDPSISYNLNVAFIFASVAQLFFGISYTLLNKLPKLSNYWLGNSLLKKANLKYIFIIFGILLLVTGGNLDLMFYSFTNSIKSYFYADARSLIPNTINEFPAYSFLISDLHAHIIDILFVLTFLGLLLLYFLDTHEVSHAKVRSLFEENNSFRTKLIQICTVCFLLGTMGITNTWDLLIYYPLLVLAILIKEKKPIYLILLVSIFLPYIPFYLTFAPATTGIGFVKIHSPLLAIVKMFGYFFFIETAFLLYFARNRNSTIQDKIILVGFIYSSILVLVPDVIFLKDIYFKANPPFYRANTVFKVWYQAWILYCICSAYTIYIIVTKFKKVLVFVISIPFIYFSYFVFLYPIVSTKYIVGKDYKYIGLNGAIYIKSNKLEDYDLIKYIQTNIQGQPIILEAVGDSYTQDSLISTYTGLPTLVGWSSHEFGWRDNWSYIAQRMGDIEKAYKTSDPDELHEIIRKYNIKYIVLSQREYTKYGQDAGNLIQNTYKPIFSENNTKLFSINKDQNVTHTKVVPYPIFFAAS